MQRYFVKKDEFNNFRFINNDFHHVKDVMRINDGEKIICIFDNASFECKIHYLSKDYKIEIIKEISIDVELNKKITLYQTLIKNDHFDLIVQKACELGVSKIVPVISSRSVIKVNKDDYAKKINRYNTIIKEACEQSHRQSLPLFENYISLKDIKIDKNTLALIAYEKEDDKHSLKDVLFDLDKYDDIAIIIGPEGGFSLDEVNYLLNLGFKSFSLGKRIYRAETAAIASLAILAYEIEG